MKEYIYVILTLTFLNTTSSNLPFLKSLDQIFRLLPPQYCIDYYTSRTPPTIRLKIPHSLNYLRSDFIQKKYLNCDVQLFHSPNTEGILEVLENKLREKYIRVSTIVVLLDDGKPEFINRTISSTILQKFNRVLLLKRKQKGWEIFQQDFFDLSGNVTLIKFIGNVSEKIFETRLKDLRGSVVLVNTWELPPFVVPVEEQGDTKYYGPDQQTILVYAEKYNFTIEYVLPSNESAKWGTYTNDSKIFSGQIFFYPFPFVH